MSLGICLFIYLFYFFLFFFFFFFENCVIYGYHGGPWVWRYPYIIKCPNGVDGIAKGKDPDWTGPLEADQSGLALFAVTYMFEHSGSLWHF